LTAKTMENGKFKPVFSGNYDFAFTNLLKWSRTENFKGPKT
jgi:hypothetical protein